MELKATRYDVADGIAVVTLARPKRRNAWTGLILRFRVDPALR